MSLLGVSEVLCSNAIDAPMRLRSSVTCSGVGWVSPSPDHGARSLLEPVTWRAAKFTPCRRNSTFSGYVASGTATFTGWPSVVPGLSKNTERSNASRSSGL